MSKQRIILLLIVIAAAIGLFAAFGMNRKQPPTYFSTKVEKGDIRDVVEATGTINAVTTVQVGSQVSGTIDKLYADFNSHVHKDEVIARIEPSLFEGALQQAKADLENAKANLASSHANTEKAKAGLEQAKADYDRTVALTKEGVMSQQQLDVSKANYDSAVAQLSSNQSQEAQAKAQVLQRQAAVSVAQTNLDHTIIRAPIDGTVIARSVDIGQTVAASLQAPTLFTIAQDLTKMQVYAKTDESDVGSIRAGQPVTFRVDAFPRDTFRGTVSQVRMNSTVVQNVVTYDTIIDFDNPEMKLFPGMTAYVSIPVAQANDVVKIPNGALRYKPDLPAAEIRALYQKYGIQDNRGRGGDQSASAEGGAAASGDQSGRPAMGGGDNSNMPGNRAGRGGPNRQSGPNAQAQGGQSGPGRGNFSQGQTQSGHGRYGQNGQFSNQGGQTQQTGNGQSNRTMQNYGAGAQRPETAVVWKLMPDKTIAPVKIRTGITDHTFTALVGVVNGELNEGDELVTGSSRAAGAGGAPRLGGGGPGGGRPGGR